MEKKNTFNSVFSKTIDILTASQMSTIRGGLSTDISLSSDLGLLDTSITITTQSVGPISATLDDKRRDRPGGGISTH